MMKNRLIPMIPLILGGIVLIAAGIMLLYRMDDETAIKVFLPATAFFIFMVMMHRFIR